mmetsp:Transcript_27415/g.49373  ORF Transcript_27415/g.49373 Transcript_27415/m.49373 type:complete len:142 (+) Transcript_27415:1461-1886(+)
MQEATLIGTIKNLGDNPLNIPPANLNTSTQSSSLSMEVRDRTIQAADNLNTLLCAAILAPFDLKIGTTNQQGPTKILGIRDLAIGIMTNPTQPHNGKLHRDKNGKPSLLLETGEPSKILAHGKTREGIKRGQKCMLETLGQ